MSKEIIINVQPNQTRIALVEDKNLSELYIETPDTSRTLGNIYLGKIRKILPNIQACFVDIGQKQDAFLHFSDLSDNLPDLLQLVGEKLPDPLKSPLQKLNLAETHSKQEGFSYEDDEVEELEEASAQNGKGGKTFLAGTAKFRKHIEHHPALYLREGQRILVKISKEPIANKGSRVSTDISIAGRFIVLVPMVNYVAVSKKINSAKEVKRLRTLTQSLLPENFGVIVRTVAEHRDAKSLNTDLQVALDKWKRMEEKIRENTGTSAVVYQDVNLVSSIVRDLFTEDYDRILIDDNKLFKNTKGYVQAVAPQMSNAIQLYEGSEDIFVHAGIEKDINSAFSGRVNLSSGGYLFLEHTEAMHVIDVNSGRAGFGLSQEENSLNVNLEAARVIARQLRLRDLGGIIVIDFIDLRLESNRRKVLQELRNEFKKDRAVTKVLPMSDFGLMQVTRQRLRQSVTTSESKSSEKKSGLQNISITEFDERLQNWLALYKNQTQNSTVDLKVHPFAAQHLRKHWFYFWGRFQRVAKFVKINLIESEDLDPLQYRFLDASGKDITTQYDYV